MIMAYECGLLNRIGEGGTWKELGIHYATLGSLERKGYVVKDNDGRYTLTECGRRFAVVEKLAEGHEFFCIREAGSAVGRLCYVKGSDIMDAWDHVFKLKDDVPLFFSYHTPDWRKNEIEI